jgi:hypothetical protein
MTIDDQIVFLTNLGKRLQCLTRPGDAEDYLTPNRPLWVPSMIGPMQPPVRVIDALLARWITIKDFTTLKPVNFKSNPAQRHFSLTRKPDEIVLKAGRAGFTTHEMMCALLNCICKMGYTAVLVAHSDTAAGDYFIQARMAYEHLAGELGPDLRAGALRTEGSGGRKNADELYFPVLNSHIFIASARTFAPAEGESIQYLIGDEMARWRHGDPKQVIATLLSHVTGDDTTTTLMSRPFGQSGEFHERYWAARRGVKMETEDRPFGAHFYQWWWNAAQRFGDDTPFPLVEEERTLAERYKRWRRDEAPPDCNLPEELLPSQLRWRRVMKSKLRDLFPQEFAEDENDCFLGSGNCPFDSIAIDKVAHDLTPVLERRLGKGETENGLLRWREPNPTHWYVLFIDPAGTLFTSRMAMFLLDGVDGQQAAEWVGRGDAESAAHVAFDLARKFERVFVAVELNQGAVSATMMAKLVELGMRGNGCTLDGVFHAWPRFYRSQDSGGQWIVGWNTDGKNRPKMLSDFGDIWAEHPEWFHSARLANEVKTSVRKGDRIEAGKGMTNDLVMAAAGAHAVRPLVRLIPKEPFVEVLEINPSAGEQRVTDTSDIGWTRLS